MMTKKEMSRGSPSPVNGWQKSHDGEVVAVKMFSSHSSPTIMTPSRSTSTTSMNSTLSQGSVSSLMSTPPPAPVIPRSKASLRLHVTNLPYRFR